MDIPFRFHQFAGVDCIPGTYRYDIGLVRNTWDFAWGSIKDCNKTIQLADELIDGKAEDIKMLVAEAQLLRAYYYSVLVAQYGAVPLITVDDPVLNLSPTRTSVAEIYAQIVSDLTVGI